MTEQEKFHKAMREILEGAAVGFCIAMLGAVALIILVALI